MVVCLVVIMREVLNNQLLALFVSTDLVLIGALVVADHLVHLRNHLPAVRLVPRLGGVVALSLLLRSHDVVHTLVLVNLHYLSLLLQGCVRSRVEAPTDVRTHRRRIVQRLNPLVRLVAVLRLERVRGLLLTVLAVGDGDMLVVELLL